MAGFAAGSVCWSCSMDDLASSGATSCSGVGWVALGSSWSASSAAILASCSAIFAARRAASLCFFFFFFLSFFGGAG
ncbi:MAG: hypothetical protein CMH53_07340 [Myxococcales bacterium]|nr:hypothetical protein [Myxococcales bacterium]